MTEITKNQRTNFLFHKDLYDFIKNLNDEQAGLFVKSMCSYCFEDILPENIFSMVLMSHKPKFDRDFDSYKKTIKQRSDAGKKSAEQRQLKSTTVNDRQHTLTSPTSVNHNLNLNLNQNDNLNQNQKEIIKEIKEPKLKFGSLKNVLLTESQVSKLKQELGNGYESMLEVFSKGIAMKNYGYKDHYLAILKWSKNDFNKQKMGKNKQEIVDTARFFLEGISE